MEITEINGAKYDVKKMAPRQQFHVFRRLAPLVTAMGPAVMDLLDNSKPIEEVTAGVVLAMGPIADVISTLPDEQLDYVMNACLQQVQRFDSGKWFPTHVAQRSELLCMYKDIDLAIELQLTAAVLKENFSGFFGQLSGGTAPSLDVKGAAAS